MQAVHIIRDAEQAAVLLQGERRVMLEHLLTPGSASSLARQMGLKRQKVNYHLRALESAGLVTLVAEKKVRNCVERIVRATAKTYVFSPSVLNALGTTPEQQQDHFSSAYLVTQASETVRQVGELQHGADQAGKRLATLCVHGEVAFASAAERHGFAEALTQAVAELTAKYHSSEPGARRYRMVTTVHPKYQPKGSSGDV